MLVIVKAELPPLVRVTVCAGVLVVPTAWLPKVRTVAERPTDPNTPVPIKLTAWGLPAVALSAILTAAVRLPEALGVKVTVIVQKLPAAREAGQLLISVKSPALLPVNPMLLMVRLRLPVFVTLTVCDGLVVSSACAAKVNVVAERLTMDALPVPVKVINWGVPGALSAMLIEAARLKMAVGVKVTLNEQVPLGVIGLTHVLV